MEQEMQRDMVERIRSQYTAREENKLERLKKLDKKVKRPAEVFAYTFGTAGALVLGTGMCLAMEIIGNLMPLGIVVGIVGIAMVSVNYLIYKAIAKSRKKKHAQEVLALSDELLNREG